MGPAFLAFGRLVEKRTDEADAALGHHLPVSWDIGPYSHFRTPRGFGVTFQDEREGPCHIRLSNKLTQASHGRQDGIIRHEIGHVVDLTVDPRWLDRWAAARGVRLPPQAQAELRADAIAQAIWGTALCYDRQTVQSTEPYRVGKRSACPARPAHLGK